METGREAELEDAKKGKVKRLVSAKSQNRQEVWIKHTEDQGEVRSRRFGWEDEISNEVLGEQKVRNGAGWSRERNTWPPRGGPQCSPQAQQVVWSLMPPRVWGPAPLPPGLDLLQVLTVACGRQAVALAEGHGEKFQHADIHAYIGSTSALRVKWNFDKMQCSRFRHCFVFVVLIVMTTSSLWLGILDPFVTVKSIFPF